MENKFNLIDEAWIPIAGIGNASLEKVFSNFEYQKLGGNSIQKITVLKLLLAIAQSACTPKDDCEWECLGVKGVSEKCLDYLNRFYDSFWLYGDKPFLQMPQVFNTKLKSFGVGLPDIATGNNLVLNEGQIERPLSNSDKALFLITLEGFALGGKKTDNSIILTPGYLGKFNDKGKEATGKAGPFLNKGLIHNFILGETLLKTIWFNLFTKKDIEEMGYFDGIGIAPWEKMPKGEDCEVAKSLKTSLMGRLVSLSKFCLLKENEFHYSDGIQYSDYMDGGIDPSIAVCFSKKKPEAMLVDVAKKPWRFLTSMLSFLSQNNNANVFDCYQVKYGFRRICKHSQKIGIWSGGLKVSYNAGEQTVSGTDDFIDSEFLLDGQFLGKIWYENFKYEMDLLEKLAKNLSKAVVYFFKLQKLDGKKQSKKSEQLFWQLSEGRFQEFINICHQTQECKKFRKNFLSFVNFSYDFVCQKETVRQLDAWSEARAKYFPIINKICNE